MQFISFAAEGRASFGIVRPGGVLDLGARLGAAVPDLKACLHLAALGNDPTSGLPATIDYRDDEVQYLPVIPNPGKILCVGLNYEEHRKETGRAEAAYPAIFTRFADTLVGHAQAIRVPTVSTALDYEGELAVVIGRPAYRVAEEHAASVIAGYTCFNDATVRDWQRHSHQFTPGKNFASTGGFGPALVTAHELPAGRLAECRIETRLNGRVMQSARLGDMLFSVPRLIAYISAFTRLSPGDVIATGTPGGVGFKRDPPVYLKAGDAVEVRIDDVGTLRNPVESE
jgi:2-keto-4-pentenoate hydratase/2-oxohepta-3-ene-1,7-dioic acid hydratase in catechol pathway